MEKGLGIVMGKEIDLSNVHKFGENTGLTSSGYETIWSQGGLYPWSEFSGGAVTVYAISTASGDTGTLDIIGLDANFVDQTETVTMTGTTAVTSTKQFARVFRLVYTDTVNAGVITVRTGSGTGTIIGRIDTDNGQSTTAIYTVPKTHKGYLSSITVGTGKNDDASVKVMCRTYGDTNFRILNQVKSYQSTTVQEFPVPLFLAPGTDLDVIGITTAANSGCIVNFDIILDKV
jgi:hypothetical protein